MAAHTGREATAYGTIHDMVRHRAGSRREHRWLGQPLAVATDAALVLFAFIAAYWLRYRLEFGGEVLAGSKQPFDFFTDKVIALVLVAIVIFQLRGLYRLPRWTSFLDEASIVASSATTAMAIVILYSFLQRFYPSRLIFIFAWMLMITLLLAKRLATQAIRQALWKRGIGVDRVLVVGAGYAGQRIMQYIFNQPQLGYRVVGFVDSAPAGDDWGIATQWRVERPPYLGGLDTIDTVVAEQQIDEVMIALPPTAHAEVTRTIQGCRDQDVGFTLVPDLFELSLDHVRINAVAGLALLDIKETSIRGRNYAVKRAMDVLISLAVLTVTAPLMLMIALAIRLDSPGPVFFRQERVGKHRRLFRVYKFRTMCKDAEQLRLTLPNADQPVPLWKMKDDPRRTRVGRFLRQTSLDELPQFFNVLKGEMSVVGPRPQVPSEVAEYDDWHYQRLTVTPGLTGLWQVNGRSDLDFNEMVKLDLYYAEHWSPWLDIKLMLRTIPAVLLARGAY